MAAKSAPQPHYFDRFYSGLYTNRNPLYTPKRIVGISVIPQNDVLIDGLNMEITPQDTLARRPGYPNFCSAALGASEKPLAFFSCRLNGTLYNLVDTQVAIYSFTPSALTLVYTKGTTSRSFFQQVGDLLYFSDGTTNKKWDGTVVTNAGIVAPTAAPNVANLNWHDSAGHTQQTHAWSPNYAYTGPASGTNTIWFQDPNGNIQYAFLSTQQVSKSANSAPSWATTFGTRTVDGDITWTCGGPIGAWVAGGDSSVYSFGNFNSVNAPTFKAGPIASTGTFSQNGAGLAWTGALLSNTLRTSSGPGTSANLVLTNLGFNIPAGAVVTGIRAFLGRAFKGGNGSVNDLSIKLTKAGVATGSNKAIAGNWSAVYTQQSYGSSSDMWGTTWGPTDVNNSGFGLSVSCTNALTAQAFVLSLRIVVFYTVATLSGATYATMILDANGNLQRVQTLGITGGSQPSWATTIGSTTTDGSMVWECMGSGTVMAALNGWDYAYGFHSTFGASLREHISTMSPRLSLRAPIIGTGVVVSGTGSDDTQVDRNDLYRNYDGGSVLFFDASAPNVNSATTWSYTDQTIDTDLNVQLVGPIADANDAPTVGIAGLIQYLGRMWGVQGTNLFFTAGPDCTNGDPNQSWPPANVFQFPETITGWAPTTHGLIIFTPSRPWIVLGGPQTLTFYVKPLMVGFGTLNPNCVAQDGDQVFIFTSNRQLVSFDFSSKDEIGKPTADKLRAFDPSVSCLAVHRNGEDEGLFLSDGSANVYRQSLNGAAFSPLAQPVGGIGIIQSIETSTGVFTLLAGPPSNAGHIQGRDIANFVDGSSTYTWSATFGSMVFATPGIGDAIQIKCLTLQQTAAGTAMSLAVLPNEISGSFTNIPFTANDPYQLQPASTIRTRRYDWLGNQSGLPNVVKHMQVKLSGVAENAKSELLGLSINPEGAV